MRNDGILKLLSTCTIVLAVCILLNIVALRAVRRQYAPGTSAAVSFFNVMGQAHEWIGYLNQWRQLAQENSALRASADGYLSAAALAQTLEAENDLLRKSAGLTARLKRSVIPAGMFAVSLMPNGYHALINKGRDDGIILGQAVISPDGVLAGKVSAVFSFSSQITLVSDPDFSVIAKVLAGQTSGILHGALSEGMNLDLITQSDEITEGDKLITTGDDLIPPGLIVGVVRNVQNNDTRLFKKVSVNPAMDFNQGAVAVIQQ